ncbi:MAG: cytochrome c oxidase assembly protein [Paenisporosarcina sp.]
MSMNNHTHIENELFSHILVGIPIFLAMFIYILGAIVSSQRFKKKWPLHRTVFWIVGIICASIAVIGPLADRAHADFVAHMFGHLLLGMLAPLLMILAAPISLLMRTLHVNHARRISLILKSLPVRVLSNPLFASIINVGGLWLLYTTNLYMLMQETILLQVLVHLHVFLAGYLFTLSIIYIDPTPHQTSFVFRFFVLFLAFSSHSILSKYIYAHPPISVSTTQAEIGGKLMYYGGDAIEAVIIFIFCYQWYKNTRPRVSKTNRYIDMEKVL